MKFSRNRALAPRECGSDQVLGQARPELNLPLSSSLSVTLDQLYSRRRWNASGAAGDELEITGDDRKARRVLEQVRN